MKRIIDGKTYDTRTAKLIAERESTHPCGPDYPPEIDTLYQTPRGRYFIDSESSAECENETVIQPISPKEALDFIGEIDLTECSCPMIGVVTNVDCPLHG
jgi:hypothetical protein